MFRFLGKNIAVNIVESQIKETVLYKQSLQIKLFNKTFIELNSSEEELYKIFLELQRKNNFGNFIDMR